MCSNRLRHYKRIIEAILLILALSAVLGIGYRLWHKTPAQPLLDPYNGTTFIQSGTVLGVISSPLPEIETLIWEASQKWDISYSLLYDLIVCESQLNPRAIGDNGLAYGLAQWHLSSWVFYNRLYDTELNILLPQDQLNMTARVLKDGGWANWFNCLKNKY